MSETLVLSALPKTWILDLDGTVLVHNGYLTEAGDCLLPGVKDFFDALPAEDMVIFITSRSVKYKAATEAFLQNSGIRFHTVIYDAPYGERILINDRKPSGLRTAYALNPERDTFSISTVTDPAL
ncbi:MAG: hypothetical protein IJ120_07870 [Solobacterium sp.]|nr:hypothetical protein [Solobacterium sp.]